MKMRLLAPILLLAGMTAPAADNDTAAAFSRLKTLVGEWEGHDTEAGKVRLSYELIAGGTALVERGTGEKRATMMTVYTVDGGRLLLTHYCMAGNQPRMKAVSFDPATGQLDFRFLDAANLADANAGHMHNARIRIIDHDHVAGEWQYYENGKLKMTVSDTYTRVRSTAAYN